MCKVNMSQADACEECANKCMLTHKMNRHPSSIVSSCVKVVISDKFLRFLPLPPRFAPRVASLVDKETWVEDSSGRKWTLTLSTVNNRLGFGEGWYSFSLAHGIKFGDILIINLILDSHFVVQIYGANGCEELIFPSRNSTTPNKSSRKTADDKNKKLSEEPCLMMVNRDTPTAGEDERVTLYDDVFTSETSKTKPVGVVDGVQKEIGSSEDTTDNHIACQDALKKKVGDKMDGSDGKGKSIRADGVLGTKNVHLESARDVEIPEQLLNGFSQDEEMLLDFDAPFEGLLGDPLDVRMGDINDNRNYEFQWTPEIDQKSNIVEKKENDISTKNSTDDRLKYIPGPLSENTDLPVCVSNVINCIINEMHTPVHPRAQIATSDRQSDGNNGKSILKEPASAICGIHSTSVRYTPVKGTTAHSVKVVKTEPKEFNLAKVGSKSEPRLKVVKDEPVDHESLQATCLVKPNSESFLEIRRGLPTTSRAEVEVKVVVLRDSSGRRWPVLYHHNYGLKGLGYGWGTVFKANGIQCGDKCVFTLEDQVESLYRVQVIRK